MSGELVMLTDGFVECIRKSNNQQYGVKRMQESLQRSAKGSAAEILSALDGEARALARSAPHSDDMTAVVMKRGV